MPSPVKRTEVSIDDLRRSVELARKELARIDAYIDEFEYYASKSKSKKKKGVANVRGMFTFDLLMKNIKSVGSSFKNTVDDMHMDIG